MPVGSKADTWPKSRLWKSRNRHRGFSKRQWFSYIWLGGSDVQDEGNWSWSDKSLWYFNNWYPGNSSYLISPEPSSGSREDCLKMKTQDGIWWDEDCNKRFRALCHRDAHVFKGKLNMTWTGLSAAVPQEIQFVWESDLEFGPLSKRTGLSISWRFEEELNTRSSLCSRKPIIQNCKKCQNCQKKLKNCWNCKNCQKLSINVKIVKKSEN